jgi:hypothetical protein
MSAPVLCSEELRASPHRQHIRRMSQPARPDATESFAARPDSGSTGDVLSTILRTVHLAGHDVTEVAADPPAKYVQRDDQGALHLVEGGEIRLEVGGAEPHLLGAAISHCFLLAGTMRCWSHSPARDG